MAASSGPHASGGVLSAPHPQVFNASSGSARSGARECQILPFSRANRAWPRCVGRARIIVSALR